MPPETNAGEALLAEVADEFRERLGRGEEPDIEEYVQRYPQFADVLRQLLPVLAVLRLPNSASAGATVPLAGPEPILGCLGDYQVLGEIGRGGMGVVYEAVQISLGRRVALKVLPFAAAMDPKQLQRFKNEAQAAAHLHHTNIVPVYSVGCERGVHFYAMQYIEGQTLAAVIRELRQLAGLECRRGPALRRRVPWPVSWLPDSGHRASSEVVRWRGRAVVSSRLVPIPLPHHRATPRRRPPHDADSAGAALSTERSAKSARILPYRRPTWACRPPRPWSMPTDRA